MIDPKRAAFVEWFIMEYGRLSPDGLIFMADTPEHVAECIERAVRARDEQIKWPSIGPRPIPWRAAMASDDA
jgi:hypothetical protein